MRICRGLAAAPNFGGVIPSGWLARGLDPADVIVIDPSPPQEMKELLAKNRIRLEAAVPKIARSPAVMLMAVKPQVMDAVFAPLATLAGPKTLVVSIAAGRTIASFARMLRSRASMRSASRARP